MRACLAVGCAGARAAERRASRNGACRAPDLSQLSSQDSVATAALLSPPGRDHRELWEESDSPAMALYGPVATRPFVRTRCDEPGPSSTSVPYLKRACRAPPVRRCRRTLSNEPPGTVVLAYYRPSKRYFPAVIESYDAAKVRTTERARDPWSVPTSLGERRRRVGRSFGGRQRRYAVKYDDDGKLRLLDRTEFFTCTDPGFANCKVRSTAGPARPARAGRRARHLTADRGTHERPASASPLLSRSTRHSKSASKAHRRSGLRRLRRPLP